METQRIVYNDKVVRQFIWASVLFGIVGMLVGIIIALQLAFWPANLPPYLSFGRLRPLHTNAVIFAFVGNMLFAGIYYSTQRLLQSADGLRHSVADPLLGLAAHHRRGRDHPPAGHHAGQGVRRARLADRHRDRAGLGRLRRQLLLDAAKRREKHLYVAIWFYIATIVTVAVLHIVNSLAIPAELLQELLRSSPACRTRSCSGGTATTRSPSS